MLAKLSRNTQETNPNRTHISRIDGSEIWVMHLDASQCERRRGHLGSNFKARFCLTGNVTHRDVKLQSGRRDGVAAEWRYRSSLLRSHILSDSHVVSRATCWEQKLEEKIHMRSTAEPFDAMVHIKHRLLGALRSVSANVPHQDFHERFTRTWDG